MATIKEIKVTPDPPAIHETIMINSNNGKELEITLLQNFLIQMDTKSQRNLLYSSSF